jgi:hypothetical protein
MRDYLSRYRHLGIPRTGWQVREDRIGAGAKQEAIAAERLAHANHDERFRRFSNGRTGPKEIWRGVPDIHQARESYVSAIRACFKMVRWFKDFKL